MSLDPSDNRTCIPNEQVLIYIMGDEIRGIDLMQPNHYTIPTIRQSPQVMAPQSIDFLVDENRLFWSDTLLNEIKSAGISNSLIETIMNTQLQKPYGFAVDWIAKHLYFSTARGTKFKILAANLNGEYVTEIHDQLYMVESIALDPARYIKQ